MRKSISFSEVGGEVTDINVTISVAAQEDGDVYTALANVLEELLEGLEEGK